MNTLDIGENTYKGYKVTINQDNDTFDGPRDWDNLGTMVCFHSRYILGDKHDHKDPDDFIYSLASEYFNEDTINNDYENIDKGEFIDKWLDRLEKHIIILPLFLYDHSGITMSTGRFSCPWDSGQVGWIYVTKEKAREEYGKKRISKAMKKKIVTYLVGEVKTYDQYLTGDVWYYNIEDPDGKDVDSCGGMYGSDYTEKECQEIVDRDFPIWKKNRLEQVRADHRERIISAFINPFVLAA